MQKASPAELVVNPKESYAMPESQNAILPLSPRKAESTQVVKEEVRRFS